MIMYIFICYYDLIHLLVSIGHWICAALIWPDMEIELNYGMELEENSVFQYFIQSVNFSHFSQY